MVTLSVFNPGPCLSKATRLLFEAFELHEKGYIVASAMTGRVAIETYVNGLFDVHGLEPRNSKAGRRLHGRIALLREVGILQQGEGRISYRMIELGNQAAHGFHVAADDVEAALLDLSDVVKGGAL